MPTPHDAALYAAYREPTAQAAWNAYVIAMLSCGLSPSWSMERVAEAWEYVRWIEHRDTATDNLPTQRDMWGCLSDP